MDIIQGPVQVYTAKMAAPHGHTINYPVVTGIKNPGVQTRINCLLKDLAHKLIAMQTDHLTDQGFKQPVIITMEGWYEIKNNQRGILSITLGNYTFPYHAAHGLTIIKSLTVSTDDGTVYTLSSLFKKDSVYVDVLSDNVTLQIKERDIPVINGFEKICPDQDYYIADRCLVLYFQIYEITPYVFGFPFFPVSVYCITDIIKEGSPLELMAANI